MPYKIILATLALLLTVDANQVEIPRVPPLFGSESENPSVGVQILEVITDTLFPLNVFFRPLLDDLRIQLVKENLADVKNLPDEWRSWYISHLTDEELKKFYEKEEIQMVEEFLASVENDE